MRNRIAIAISIITLATVGIFTVANASGKGPQGFEGKPRPFHGMMSERMAADLSLTDAQKTDVKSLVNAERATVEPLMSQLEQNRQEMRAATKNGNFDEAQVRSLAQQHAKIMTELIVERERTKAKIYGLLTAEQKAKADQLMDHFEMRGPRPGPRHEDF
jgi:periplasmic protein CpxP/Spy